MFKAKSNICLKLLLSDIDILQTTYGVYLYVVV